MRPIQNAGGEETIRARSYPVAKATAITAGQVVQLSGGKVVPAAAAQTAAILGIAGEDHSGTEDILNPRADGDEILVCDNPGLIFECPVPLWSSPAAAAETAKALRSVQPREIRLRIPAGKLARVLGDKAHLLFLARAPLALTPGQLTHRPLVSGAFAPQSRRLDSAIVLMALRRGSAVPLLRRAVLRGRHDLPDLFRSFVFVHLGLLSAGVRPGPRIPLR